MTQLLSRKYVITLLVLIMVTRVSISGAEKGCNAPTAFTGSTAKITCYFDNNVAQLQRNVFMEHLIVNAFDHEIVVSCQLIQGKYVCTCIEGYRVVGNVTDFLTVEIPTALPEHAGLYWCGGFEPHPLERNHCKLAISDRLRENAIPTPSIKTIISVVILCLVTCIFTIIIVIMCRRRMKKYSQEEPVKKDIVQVLLL